MNERVSRLRQLSLDAKPSISAERAQLLTKFYKENEAKCSVPVVRAKAFKYLCEHKTIYIGDDELIVGLPQRRRPRDPRYERKDQLLGPR